jgi:quercetin dioxygenase-like cupin family protein
MKMQLKRWNWAVVFAVALLLLVLNAAPGAATPSAGVITTPLARGTDVSAGTIPLQQGTDIAVSQITIQPAGSSGWHMHPGGAIVVVKQGEVTVYRSEGSQCEATTYTAGQAFIERPGEVHDAVNTGSVPYVAFATYPRVAPGAATKIDMPDPGTCPGL